MRGGEKAIGKFGIIGILRILGKFRILGIIRIIRKLGIIGNSEYSEYSEYSENIIQYSIFIIQ